MAQAASDPPRAASATAAAPLIEHLVSIHSAIVSGAGLDALLDAIASATRELLGDDIVGLRLIDETEPSQAILVASAGLPDAIGDYARSAVGVGAGGRAITENKIVRIDDYGGSPAGIKNFKSAGISRAMAAPLHERSTVVGSLTTGRLGAAAGRYRPGDEPILALLAGCASLALSNARFAQDAIDRAHSDSLTGLASRLMSEKHLIAELARAEADSTEVAVLAIGLDNFGAVNEALGRSCGDAALVAAAQRIATCTGPDDTVGRSGGDEFVAILHDCGAEAAERLASAMIRRLEEPFVLDENEVFLSASVGIAVAGGLGSDLMRDAEAALGHAKLSGRGRATHHDPSDSLRVRERISLEQRLAAAIREDELFLVHQPVVELPGGEIVACEALVRWRHPEGVLGPTEFIPVAEQGRLIYPLGRWVIAEACRALAEMRREQPQLCLHVNLSATQLTDPELIATIADSLAAAGLEPSSMLFELTETAFILDEAIVTTQLEAIKALGARTAVDDFGTGNASLRHLAQFPLDMLKIDRSFVARILTDPRQEAIARSITELGRGLGMVVVAEGVETRAQADFVTRLGCAQGQGFHFARPMEAGALTPMLRAGTVAAAPV